MATDRKAFRFFLEHAGYCTPPGRAQCALELARAERWAAEQDLCFCWEPDSFADASFVDTWDAKDRERWAAQEHECFVLTVRDFAGNVLASVGGVFDPDPAYSRVLEAELASEAMANEQACASVCAI